MGRFASVIAVMLLAVGIGAAQTAAPTVTAIIIGGATDTHGAGIGNAIATLATCANHRVVASMLAPGGFCFRFIRDPEACYEVSVAAPGFLGQRQEVRFRSDALFPTPQIELSFPLRRQSDSVPVPLVLPAAGPDGRERKLTRLFFVAVPGRGTLLVTIHEPQAEMYTPVLLAVSTWHAVGGKYRLLHRIEREPSRDNAMAGIQVGTQPYLLLDRCGRHMDCDLEMMRIEADGRLTVLKAKGLPAALALKPGEELIDFQIVNETLEFAAYVCLPATQMPCFPGDRWQSDPAWGAGGPQMFRGNLVVEGDIWKVKSVERRVFDGMYYYFPELGQRDIH